MLFASLALAPIFHLAFVHQRQKDATSVAGTFDTKNTVCPQCEPNTATHCVIMFPSPILCHFCVTSPIMAASQWNAACILVIYASLCHPELSSCSCFMQKHPDSLLSPNLWYLLHTCNLNFQCGSRDVSSQIIQPLSAWTETEILQVVDVPSV